MTLPSPLTADHDSIPSTSTIDPVQWRALHAVMFRNNFRAANVLYRGTGTKPGRKPKKPRNALWVLISYGFVGFYSALLVGTSPTPFFGEFAVLSLMSVMALIGLMVESPNSLYSKMDFEILGYTPVSAKTYMASKVSAALAYNGILCTLVAAPSLIILLVRDGVLSSLGWVVAAATCMVFICLVVMCLFSALVNSASPDKLRNITSAFQMLGLLGIMSLFLMFMPGASDTFWKPEALNLADNKLLLFFPPYWFLTLFLLVGGHSNATVLIGSSLAILGSLPFIWYLSVKGSSRFFEKLSESLTDSSSAPRRSSSWSVNLARIAKSLSVENFAVWKLAISHVKYDQTLRNVICSVPPLMIFYLAIPIYQGSLADPFVDKQAIWEMGMVYFGLLFAPSMSLDICRISQQYRASWLLFISPVSLPRFTLAITDWVSIVIVLPFLVLLAIAFIVFFESPLNAIMHTVTLGWLTYAMLLLKAMVNPVLPFTEYYNTSKFIGGMVLSVIVIGLSMFIVLYVTAEWVYRSTMSYYISVVVGIFLCYALRHAAHAVCKRRFRKLEFAG